MKLPEQATLGLQPNYAPGETVPTKLKQAVVIRMSADALNALQTNTSSLHVQFGATPGLYISDSFYSMQPIKEESRHELYLRAASQSKPNAPLKLFANITGKCSVDRLATEPERSDAGSVPRKKKEKESVSMFRKPARPSASTSVTATIVTAPSASSSSSAIKPSLPPAPSRRPAAAAPEAAIPSTNLSMDLRSRMIHCLALHERPIEVLTKAVGAETSQIWVHLKQIAVPSPNRDNQPGIPYKLIPEAYKEVRPWDWPKLNTNERAVMAKAARDAFTKLGLPPTDPAWSHVDNRPLPPDPVLAPRPAATSDGQAKRGITSKEMRDKKVKPKAEKKEIKIKDEGIRTSANVSTPSLEPGIRRPGSGFKMPRVSPVAETKSVATATSSKAATTSSLSSSQPRLKKVKEEDVGSDRDSLSSRPKVNDSTPAAKRKISSRRNDDDDYDPVAAGSSTKRRKTEEAGRPTQNPVRDLSLPKKPEPPRARIPAPEPVRRVKQEKSPPAMPSMSASSSSSRHSKGKSKSRRSQAPEYTSSEDEPIDAVKRQPSMSSVASSNLPTPPSDFGSSSSSGSHALPSRRDELRTLYDVEYLKYSQLNVKLLGQRNAIQKRLKPRSTYTMTSDSEVDLMDIDTITSLTHDWQKSSDLLERIRSRFDDAMSD